MAIILRKDQPRRATIIDQAIDQLQETMQSTASAKQAMYAGLLDVKRDELRAAARLVKLGMPLLVGIIFVSFLHLFEIIVLYNAPDLPRLHLFNVIYYASAALFTLSIDLSALYLVASGGIIKRARIENSNKAKAYFLAITVLLNGYYFLKYAPSLAASIKADVLPILDMAFIGLLAVFIAVAIVAIESARDKVTAAMLDTKMQVSTLEHLTTATAATAPVARARVNVVQPGVSGHNPNIASGSDKTTMPALGDTPADAIIGGRRLAFDVQSLAAVFTPGATRSRSDIVEALECSASTADKLLAQAQADGLIEKIGRGVYQLA